RARRIETAQMAKAPISAAFPNFVGRIFTRGELARIRRRTVMESKKTVTTDSGAPVAHNKLMPAADEARHRFNPFDASNVWSHRDFPLITVRSIVLIRNPENCFPEVEQAA